VSRRFERGLQRFLLESRALASFHNPGIVRVLRYFRANETAYMVMDYETGQPLQRWLVGRLPLDKTMLLRIVRPLLDGLEVVHGTGFLHRDIKPENIYIRADGSPVLLDFGSARRVEADGSDQALTAVLTPASPRPSSTTATASRGHGPIYALAGVMYWMVTGNRPMEAFARLREDTMPAAAEIGNKDVFDIELLRAIDWALKPDEDDRPRRVADFRRACLGGPVGEVAPPEPPRSNRCPSACRPTRRAPSSVPCCSPTWPRRPTRAPAARGRALLARLLRQVLGHVSPTARLVVNTKEGCAVCCVGDPEDALRAAVQLGEIAAAEGLGVHMGINLGPVRVAPTRGRTGVRASSATASPSPSASCVSPSPARCWPAAPTSRSCRTWGAASASVSATWACTVTRRPATTSSTSTAARASPPVCAAPTPSTAGTRRYPASTPPPSSTPSGCWPSTSARWPGCWCAGRCPGPRTSSTCTAASAR
jgi:serine/threonine protein kinase